MVAIFTGLGSGFERGSAAVLGSMGLLGSASLGRNNEGVSLNAANGNLLINQRDEFLTGRGLDAAIARTYNSRGTLDENGDHWRQSTDRRVFGLTGAENTAGSTVKRISADGSEITYTWTGGTTYQATDGAGAHDTLLFANNTWTWTDGTSQVKETYIAYGAGNWRLKQVIDPDGNAITLEYGNPADTGDKLTKIFTANGEYIEYSWAGNNITEVRTFVGSAVGGTTASLTRTRYEYDTLNRLAQVIVDLTPENNIAQTTGALGAQQGITAQSYVTTYTYDGASRRIATIGQTDGSLLTMTYDGSGRVTQIVQNVASGETRTTTYLYGSGFTNITDPRGQITKLHYDAGGQLTGVDAPSPGPGQAAQASRFTYDAFGNVTEVRSGTVSAGAFTQLSITRYVHDAMGNVVRTIDANGNVTDRYYDPSNNLVLETAPASASANRSISTGADTGAVAAGSEVVLSVLVNDIDPENDARTITHIGNQAVSAGQSVRLTGGGVVTLNAGGTLSYRAPSGQSGNVAFSYTVSDGGRSTRGIVTVSVTGSGSTAPLTGSDSASVYAGQSVVLNLLGNDIDPQGTPLSLASIAGTAVTTAGQVITLAGGMGTVTFLGAGEVRYTALAGQAAGSVPFSYTASDGTLTTSGSVSVSVLAASALQTPFAANDLATVMAGQSVTFDPRVNDADPEGGVLTITKINGQAIASGQSVSVSGGTLTLNANGTFTYAAPAGQTPGSVPFTYTVRDPQNLEATATATINVIANTSAATPTVPGGGGNAAPVAVNDIAGTVTAGQSLVILALTNDRDPEGSALSVTHIAGTPVSSGGSVTLPNGDGTVTRNANGTLTYLAPAGQTGPKSFTYTVSDGALSTTATVSLTLIAAGGGAGTYTASEVMFADAFSGANTGTSSQSGSTAVISTEQAYAGTSSIKTTINQWSQGGLYAERTITSGQNSVLQFWVRRASASSNGTLLLRHGSGWTELALGTSNNQSWSIDGVTGKTGISDLQLNTWHRVEVNLSALGVTELKSVHLKNFDASQMVVYLDQMSLGAISGGGAPNQAPVVANDAAGTVTAGQSLVISPLANDSDPENQALTITHVNSQAVASGASVNLLGGGSVTRNANGTLTYTAPAGQSGPVSFTYTVSDGTLLATALVSLTVQAASNQAPVAVNDIAGTVTAGQSLVILALTNDRDPEGSALSVTHIAGTPVSSGGSVTLPNGDGTVTRNANGTLTYLAPAGQTGPKSFTYTVSDGALSTTATVSLTLIAAGGGAGTYTASEVMFADAFSGANTGTSSQSGSTAVISTEQAYAGTSSIKTTINQWSQGGLYAERTITSGQNSVLQFWVRRASASSNGTLLLRHGSGWTELALGTSNNQSWSIDGVTGKTGISDLQLNTWHRVEVNLSALGVTELKSVHLKNFDASQMVVYLDQMSLGAISGGGAPNQAPVVANDAAGTVTAGQSLVISPLANDSDPENQALTITHVNSQAVASGASVNLLGGGSVTRNANGTLTYTAPAGQSGPVSFTYTVSDGTLLATALVSLTVQAAGGSNTAPLTGSDSASVYAGQSVVLNLLGNDIDPQGTPLSLASIAGTAVTTAGQVITLAGGMGTVTFLGAGEVRYTALAGQAAGSVPFSYTASDGTLTTSGSVSVSVLAASALQTPFAANDLATVMAGQSVTFDPRVNDADPEGGVLTITKINGQAIASGQSVSVSGGTLTLNANGTFTYAAPAGQTPGSVPFTYTVRDPQNLEATATATINVIANTSAATPTVPGGGGGPLPATFVAASDTVGTIAEALNFTASAGQTRLVYDTANRLRYSISGEGNVREYIYGTSGLLNFEKTYPDHEYTAAGLIPTQAQMDTWRDGLADRSTAQVMEYRYDVRGNLIETVRWGGATSAGAPIGSEGYQHTYYTYDQAGQLLSRRTLPDAFAETFVFDGLGRMISSTSRDGGTTTVAFQDSGTTTTVTTSPLGHATTSTFNKASELVSQTDSGAGIAAQATANRSFVYNANGQLQRTTVRVFDTRYDTSYVLYDLAGRKVADIGHNGELTEYRYDALGRIAATIRYASTLSAAALASLMNPDLTPAGGDEVLLANIRPTASPNDIWQWSLYDTGGRVIRTVQGNGSVTSYTYDASDRLITTYSHYNKLSVAAYMTATSLGAPATALPASDTRDAIGRTFYDRDDRVIGTLNGEGHLTRNVYDEAGRKIEETAYANASSTSLRASGTYQQLWDSVTKDAAKDITSRFVYDGQGLLRFTIDALSRVSETVYFENFISEANGAARSIVQHAAPLGGLANYRYATVKSAVAALGQKADNRTSWMIYNERGQLTFTVDASGAVSGLTYDTEGRVTKTVQYAALSPTATLPTIAAMNTWAASNAANARTTRTYYSARGEVLATIDAEGYVTRSYYHAEGQLRDEYRFATQVSATDAWTLSQVDSAIAGQSGTAQLTRYILDRLGRISDIYDPLNMRTYIQYSANGQKEMVVRAHGSADAVTEIMVYDQAGRVISQTTGHGSATPSTTLYSYDGLGNLATTTDPRGTVTSYAHDKLGRVLMETRAVGQAEQAVAQFEYDAFGQVVKTTDARNNSSFNFYDRAGRLTASVDAEGYLTTQTYTAFGEIDSAKRWMNKASNVTTNGYTEPGANALDATTGYSYDKLGRLVRTTNALGNYAETDYNAFGNAVRMRDARGNYAYAWYDRLGRETHRVDQENYLIRTDYVRNSDGTETISTRQYMNRLTGTPQATVVPANPPAHANDSVTQRVFDKLGQLIKVIDADQFQELYGYDLRGNRTTSTNKLGATTTYIYDKLDRLIQETVPAAVYTSAGWLVASSIVNKFEYDANGNRTKSIEAFDRPEQRTTTYVYDKLNRATSVLGDAVVALSSSAAAAGSATSVPAESFVYDGSGNVIQHTDANGTKTFNWYDKLGRLTHQLTQQSGTQGTLARHVLDASGQVTQTSLFATLVTLPGSAGGLPPADPGTDYRRTEFVYDKLGQLKESKVKAVTTGAMGASYVQATSDLTTLYEHDAAGKIIRTQDPNGASVYAYYDKLGQKVAEVDQSGYLSRLWYDANGNLTQETRYAAPPAGPVTTSGYGTIVENWPGGDAATALAQTLQDRVTTYSYDKLGRRVTESRRNVLVYDNIAQFVVLNSEVTFTYNALGQVATKTEAAGGPGAPATNTYTYDTSGRLVQETREAFSDHRGVTVTPTTVYRYDGLNNLVRTRVDGAAGDTNDAVTAYTYGAGGRLASVTDAEGFVRTYRYSLGGRVLREEYSRLRPDGTSVDEAIVYAYDAQGRVTAQYTAAKTGSGTYDAAANTGIAETRYNAFGDISQRGTNGVFAETFSYDNAGRLIATNSGDGVWKYFLHDRNGNQTLSIVNTGAATGLMSRDTALAQFPGDIATSLGTQGTGLTATITKYDARGLAVQVIEPQRELSATGARQTLTTSRTYNAFGEVRSETNALGATVDYTYNTMGRRIKTESPLVAVTGENGVTTNLRPTEYMYYDRSGRLVASRDANGNLTRMTLLAGTGFGGTEALVTSVTTADNAVMSTGYDIQGNARKLTDQIARVTTQLFDRMGRLVTLNNPNGLTSSFQYDGLGREIKRWNNQLGSANAESTLYDAQGRIQQKIAAGGDTTNYSYAWVATNPTTGLGTFGNWQKTTHYANGLVSNEYTDPFGRLTWNYDMSGHVQAYSYDTGGRLLQTSTSRPGGATQFFTYYNSGQLKRTEAGNRVTEYSYDAAGNLAAEKFTQAGAVFRDATATYDALGRMTAWYEAASSSPNSQITWKYDANGNIRQSDNRYFRLDANGQPITAFGYEIKEHWYRFDSMNRVVTDKGTLSGGQIVRSTTGTDVFYDAAGQRAYTLTSFLDSEQVQNPYYDPETPGGPNNPNNPAWINYEFYNTRREDFVYNAAGQVGTVQVAEGVFDPDTYAVTAPTGPGAVRSVLTYDLLGRQTQQTDYKAGGSSAFSSTKYWNAKSQIDRDDSYISRDDNKTIRADTYYFYSTSTENPTSGGTAADYALGSVKLTITHNYENGTHTGSSSTKSNYLWFDGAVQSTTEYRASINASGAGTAQTSYFTYDHVGSQSILSSVQVNDGRPRTITFKTDLAGQTIRRDELQTGGVDNSPGDPHEIWYRFGGKELGYTGNNSTTDIHYAASIAARTKAPASGTPGAFLGGATTASSHTEFDPSLSRINSYNQGSSSGGYTVRAGETLASIAANLWGDSSLWYKLAEANGLSGQTALNDGQSIRIPAGVTKNTHNASTFQPYDPSETIGDTSPTTPKPPKKNKCGTFGQVLLVVIAVAVAAVVSGGLAGLAGGQGFWGGAAALVNGSSLASIAGVGAASNLGVGIAAGAIGGAAGSIVSQGVGVATGIQQKFSWNAVAMAAIGGGVGASGFGKGVAAGFKATGRWATAISGAANNALTQGVGMAVGAQRKFSWAGVAAAGVGAVAGDWATGEIGGTFGKLGETMGGFATQLTAGSASALASAATRTALGDGQFGDNIRAAIPDIIGQALGNVLVGGIGGRLSMTRERGSPTQVQAMTPDEAAALQAQIDGGMEGISARRVELASLKANNPAEYDRQISAMLGVSEGGAGGYPMEVFGSGSVANSSVSGNGNTPGWMLYELFVSNSDINDLAATLLDPRNTETLPPHLTAGATGYQIKQLRHFYAATSGIEGMAPYTEYYNGQLTSYSADQAFANAQTDKSFMQLLQIPRAAIALTPLRIVSAAPRLAGFARDVGQAYVRTRAQKEASTATGPGPGPSLSPRGGPPPVPVPVPDPRRNDRLMCEDIGQWVADPRYSKYSAQARAYQDQIGGRPGTQFAVPRLGDKPLNFDGCTDTNLGPVLLEAKGLHPDIWDKPWFQGGKSLVAQGQAQQRVAVALGVRAEWHFASLRDMNAVGALWSDATPEVTLPRYHTPAR